jgi:hypothetical protein
MTEEEEEEEEEGEGGGGRSKYAIKSTRGRRIIP